MTNNDVTSFLVYFSNVNFTYSYANMISSLLLIDSIYLSVA